MKDLLDKNIQDVHESVVAWGDVYVKMFLKVYNGVDLKDLEFG